MIPRILRARTLLLLLLTFAISGLFILIYSTHSFSASSKACPPCNKNDWRQQHRAKMPLDPHGSGDFDESGDNVVVNRRRLCLLVPFRDRFDELLVFVPHMTRFLRDQGVVDHTIYVLNQADKYRFNRASLINAGFSHAIKDEKTGCDYFALHDVDLLPLNPDLKYSYPEKRGPVHLSPPGLHPKYDYPNFIGGIMLLRKEDFVALDGMSNRFWGWGLEDDEFFARIRDSGMTISRPRGIGTGRADTFRHLHSAQHRARDYRKCYNQRDVTRRRDRETGLADLKFEVVDSTALDIAGQGDGGGEAIVLSVKLLCDESKTPWCDCKNAPGTESPLLPLAKEDNIMPYLPKKQRRI